MINHLISWWQQRELRERYLLIIGGSILVIAILYHVVIAPWQQGLSQQKTQYQHQEQLLTWMQARWQDYQPYHQVAEDELASVPLSLSHLNQALQQAQLSPYVNRLQQQSSQRIFLSFEQVPFDPLMDVLEKLAEHHHYQIEHLKLHAADESGFVTAELTLMM